MGLAAANRFQSIVTNVPDGTQPTSAYGTLVGAGAAVNVYGAPVTIVAPLDWGASGDAYVLEVILLNGWAAASARNSIVTITVDGVDFVADLAAAKAGTNHTWGGIRYRFPVHVAAGSEIAAKVQTGDAALAGVYVVIRLHCDPTKPWTLRTGTFVRTLGANLATTLGTAFVAGAGADGAWASVGVLADAVWAWEVGYLNSDGALSANHFRIDVGIGAAKAIALAEVEFPMGTTETITKHDGYGGILDVASGEEVFVRAQGNGGEAGDSAIVYAVGGRYTPPGVYAVAGTITIAGAAAPNGKTVQIYGVDTDGVAELVGTTATGGGTGAFYYAAPDVARYYFASYEDGGDVGRSATGTASISTFDIAIGGGGGAAAVTIIEPTPDVDPGAPGGFPLDVTAARATFVVAELEAGTAYACVVATYPGSATEHVVYRAGEFRAGFAASSWSEVVAGATRLYIRPDGGWPSSAALADVSLTFDARK